MMEEENGGGSIESEKLLNSIVDELQTNFVTIPFEAWSYVCKKTINDLKIRFPNLKDLTELDEKTYYTRYLFHVTRNYKEFFTCLLTGFPVPPFPAEVESLLEAKAQNPTCSKFPSSITESVKTSNSKTVKTNLNCSKFINKRIIDYEDTEADSDDDTSSVFSEANLITKGARNNITISRKSSCSPNPLSTKSESLKNQDNPLNGSNISSSILNDDFLTPLLEKDSAGESLSEKSYRFAFINPERPTKKRSLPPVPTFSPPPAPPTKLPRPPPLESLREQPSTPPPPTETCLTLDSGINPPNPSSSTSSSSNHEISRSARLQEDAIRIKEEQRLRDKPDFVEEISWYPPKLLSQKSRLPHHEKKTMIEIACIGSPPPVALERLNESSNMVDPRRLENKNISSGHRESPIEAVESIFERVDDYNTTTNIIIDEGGSSFEEDDDEEDDLDKGVPVTSETFEESFERRGTSDHSSSSSVVSDRSSYTNNSYIKIRRKSGETSSSNPTTTGPNSRINSTSFIPPLFKPTTPTVSPTVHLKSPEAFIPFSNPNNDSNNKIHGSTSSSSNSSVGTWINGANQTFQTPNPQPQQQQVVNQNWTNIPTQNEINPGQAFAAAAAALTSTNNNPTTNLAFHGNDLNPMNTYNATSISSDFVPHANNNNLHQVMNNNQNIMSNFHNPIHTPNPFIPNPFEQQPHMPNNVISPFNNAFNVPNVCMPNTSNNNNGYGLNRNNNNKFISRFNSQQSRAPRRPATSNSANLTSIPRQSSKNN